jgi:hypothetical protein
VPDTPITGVDAVTGEITDEPQIRPFAELLTLIDRGAAHAEASEALHTLIASVQSTGRKGGMAIAIEIEPLKGSTDQVIVKAQVSTKLPKQDPTSAMYFVDPKGNLSRQDPRQMEIEGLRVVEPKTARIAGTKESS